MNQTNTHKVDQGPLDLRTYARQRLAVTFTPVAHLQRTPYSGPTRSLSIRTVDSIDIVATLFPRGQQDLLIICHGFAASQRSLAIVWLAEALAGPWDVLTFDWRGYGQSGGLASMGGIEALDLAAVLRFARERGYRRVGVIGESMGGLITLATLGTAVGQPFPHPDRVATIGAPADYALTGGMRPYLMRNIAPQMWARPFAPLLGFRLGPLNPVRPLDVVGQFDRPLLLLHGDADATVPVQNAYMLHEHVPAATLRIYEGVDHGITAMRVQSPTALIEDLRAYFGAMG